MSVVQEIAELEIKLKVLNLSICKKISIREPHLSFTDKSTKHSLQKIELQLD